MKKLPLLGIPKWRAPELVDQVEDNLLGSVFVDYIGSYKKLPYGLKADIVGDENMILGSEASLVDLELVITHALAVAAPLINGPQIARYALYKRLEEAEPEDQEFFGSNRVFRSNHEGNWPIFLFTVGNGHIQALRYPVATQSKVKKL